MNKINSTFHANNDADWRSAKPRMHVASEGDPDPESGDFQQHVRCEHTGLSVNIMNRCQISRQVVTSYFRLTLSHNLEQGVDYLKKLFPRWDPAPAHEEACSICAAQAYASREDRREVKKRAEEEKVG